MSLRTSSKSSLFLIEMIVVILFFSIAGAICVSLFVQARLISLESTRLTLAVNQCQNAAEALRAVGDDPDALHELLGARPDGDEGYLVEYDAEGQPVEQGGSLRLVIRPQTEGDALRATLTMVSDETEIYQLQTEQYRPQ